MSIRATPVDKERMQMKSILTVLSFTVTLFLLSCSSLVGGSSSTGYKMMSIFDLQELIRSNEDFIFVNVHIPLEGNISGTDFTVPYNEIEQHLDLFPSDKDARIVIYCRSGNMGNDASQTLVENGYTNVSNLEGGYNQWKAQGLPFGE